MKRAWQHVIGFVLLISSITVFAQETAISFEFQEDAIVQYGASGEWDSRHTGAGAVIYHDGQFHMFRNGYQAWLYPSGIGYLTSDDGINWEEVQEDPVFMQEQIPFEVKTALLTSALVEEDGTWVFYFALFHSIGSEDPTGIVRATADSPTGEWTVDEEFLLEAGTEGEWDSSLIAVTSVIRTEDGYLMHYAADDGEIYAIGLATSEDGINWTKYDDPATDSVSDPVFVHESDWEVNVQDPRVVETDEGFVMLYSSFDENFRNQGYNFAFSEDGITWERVADEAIIPREAFSRNPWFPTLAYHDGTYLVYIEVDSRAGTDIFVGTYEGVLR